MNTCQRDIVTERTLQRVCGEFFEMPGLRLTRQQAQRLWGMQEDLCTEVLELLVEAKFLTRTGGSYSRLGDGRFAIPHLSSSEAAA